MWSITESYSTLYHKNKIFPQMWEISELSAFLIKKVDAEPNLEFIL
jgi:hypothetical protein